MHHIKAVITKQNGKQSTGRGFSPSELAKAGVNKQQAKQMGIPVDVKRKSAHDENIATLKAHAQKAQAEAKPKPQKTEPRLKKKAKKLEA
jgi:ribosomal protein L13E